MIHVKFFPKKKMINPHVAIVYNFNDKLIHRYKGKISLIHYIFCTKNLPHYYNMIMEMYKRVKFRQQCYIRTYALSYLKVTSTVTNSEIDMSKSDQLTSLG